MFITQERIAVTVDGENTIWLRKGRMDFGTQSRLLGLIKDRGQAEIMIALMQASILAWDGPAFIGHPCTPTEIEHLDPDDPLVAKVLAVFAELNAPPAPVEPASPNPPPSALLPAQRPRRNTPAAPLVG